MPREATKKKNQFIKIYNNIQDSSCARLVLAQQAILKHNIVPYSDPERLEILIRTPPPPLSPPPPLVIVVRCGVIEKILVCLNSRKVDWAVGLTKQEFG